MPELKKRALRRAIMLALVSGSVATVLAGAASAGTDRAPGWLPALSAVAMGDQA